MKPVFFTCLILLFASAPAYAQDDEVIAPPGNSGVEEYLEIVPGAGGDRPAGGGGQANPSPSDAGRTQPTPREILGAETARELRRLGPDGRAAAEVAAATAPPESSADTGTGGGKRSVQGSGSGAKSGGSTTAAADDDRGGRADAVGSALAGSGGGMGLAFPLLLLGALAAALGLLAVRRVARHE